jgi:hypothetical protein
MYLIYGLPFCVDLDEREPFRRIFSIRNRQRAVKNDRDGLQVKFD